MNTPLKIDPYNELRKERISTRYGNRGYMFVILLIGPESRAVPQGPERRTSPR